MKHSGFFVYNNKNPVPMKLIEFPNGLTIDFTDVWVYGDLKYDQNDLYYYFTIITKYGAKQDVVIHKSYMGSDLTNLYECKDQYRDRVEILRGLIIDTCREYEHWNEGIYVPYWNEEQQTILLEYYHKAA